MKVRFRRSPFESPTFRSRPPSDLALGAAEVCFGSKAVQPVELCPSRALGWRRLPETAGTTIDCRKSEPGLSLRDGQFRAFPLPRGPPSVPALRPPQGAKAR